LFSKADEEHIAIGEGTTEYLYSPAALNNIKKFNPDAKIIIMLRNPVEMVLSLHKQWIHSLFEDEEDFERAWALQEERAKGNSIPKLCREPQWLIYGKMASYSSYVEQVYKVFSADNVKIIIFEEFISQTETVFNDVLRFLNIPPILRSGFPRVNGQREFSSKISKNIALNTPVFVRNFVTRMRFISLLSWIPDILDYIFKSESKNKKGFNQMSNPKFREYLVNFFEADVHRLSLLINKNLDHWQ
jgi:hypothetical protein